MSLQIFSAATGNTPLRHCENPPGLYAYRGLPALASLSMAGSEGDGTSLKADRKRDPEVEFVTRWLDLLSDLERTLDQQPDALQQTFDTLANLFLMRWTRKSDQTYIKALLGKKNKHRRGRKGSRSIQTRHLAASLGTSSPAIDNLIVKGGA